LFSFFTTNFRLKLWPFSWFKVPFKFGIKSQWWRQKLQCPSIWKKGSKEAFSLERLSKCFLTSQSFFFRVIKEPIHAWKHTCQFFLFRLYACKEDNDKQLLYM
jgi:hypothetical protein